MQITNLSKYRDFFSHYTELRFQQNRSLDISLLNGNIVANQQNISGGMSARVFQEGGWGFASTPMVDD
ncbi:MAG: hypothetical protein OXB84_01580 [Halobacteriovoraceae bacterium]|nr:hypothetical protein [Halobacteriovoraceae bacterium]